MNVFLILFFFAFPMPTLYARTGGYEYPDGLRRAVGPIRDIRRNTIEMYDEQDHQIKNLIDVKDYNQFKKGDRVRVYYQPRTNLIEDIKKMTPLEYHSQGQNLGYLKK